MVNTIRSGKIGLSDSRTFKEVCEQYFAALKYFAMRSWGMRNWRVIFCKMFLLSCGRRGMSLKMNCN